MPKVESVQRTVFFCAQSLRWKTHAPVYPLMDKNEILKKALDAKKHKVKRFSIVISGIKPSKQEMKKNC